MKRGTLKHPKTTNLMRVLGISRYQAVGILESLWHFTMRYAVAGDVGKWTNDEIVAAIEWEGDAQTLIAALVETKWLDADKRYRLIVHDWHEHADQTCKRYIASHCLAFASLPVPDPVPVPDPIPVPVPDPEAEPKATAADKPPFIPIVTAWNALCPRVRKCRKLTDARKATLKIRLADDDWNWEAALKAILNSPFLCGDNDRGWKANFDWFIQRGTVTKILEGQYDGDAQEKHAGTDRRTHGGSAERRQGKFYEEHIELPVAKP